LSILGMDIGWGELLIILIVALLVVGPEKLPEYARKAARAIRKIQKVTSAVTGDISKAINLDDDDGKAAGMKKDLIEVKKSLERDVADLKAQLDEQAKAVSQTMETSTKKASEQLEENAGEISKTLKNGTEALNAGLDTHASIISETLESGSRKVNSGLEQSTGGMPDTLDEQKRNDPESVPDAGGKTGSGTVATNTDLAASVPAQGTGESLEESGGCALETAAAATGENVAEPLPALLPSPKKRNKSPEV